MDSTHPPEAWEKLGRALELRRWQLGYGYRQRGRFARERGSAVSEKTIARLERGERGAYPDATLADAEALYGLVPGSIRRHLDGGELEPLPESAYPNGFRYADPNLQAIWDLPARSAGNPGGLTEAQREGLIAQALGMRAVEEAGGRPRAVPEAPAQRAAGA
jgi:hypothetical protein